MAKPMTNLQLMRELIKLDPTAPVVLEDENSDRHLISAIRPPDTEGEDDENAPLIIVIGDLTTAK
jgi:hypothetical protein